MALSADEIFKITSQPGHQYSFAENEVLEEINFTAANYSANWIQFNSITFHELVFVKEVHLGVGIGFSNCIFKKGIVLENTTATGYHNDFSQDSDSIWFKSCEFKGLVQFRGNKTNIEREIKLKDCKLDAGIEFNGTTVSVQGITFDSCVINYRFDVNAVNLKQGLSLFDCIVDARSIFNTGQMNSVALVRCHFKKDLQMWGCNIHHHLAFNDGQYDDGIRLKAILGNGSLSIIGGKFNDSFWVDYEDRSNKLIQGFKKLYFDSCEFLNGMHVNGVQSIAADRPLINEITLIASSKMQGDISLSHLHVGEIYLKGINTKATIKFDDIHVNRLTVDHFYNYSQVVLLGVRASYLEWFKDINTGDGKTIKDLIESRVSFTHSNLGKTHLYSFNFESFKKTDIYNSILSEIIVSNVRWFDPRSLGLVDLKVWLKGAKKQKKKITKQDTVAIDLLSRREIFRQLKYACDKQGDRVQALAFQKWEMNYYRKYLQVIDDKNWDDRFILWSSLSNDYGQSWFKALWVGLIFTFLFYIPIVLLASEKVNVSCLASNWSEITLTFREVFNQLYVFILLLNPTHSLDKIFPNIESVSHWIYLFDFLFKVITAYFIFQIISAFRKYVK